ncbi:helix-turn-helix transcriptional regulator [Raoultibacter phocaeensis]|uniref:helix-turn-helix transcriptional regulator n=1 Tax=Raoultibacter phocaeensis TaxID=2479841 RepID=UPI001117B94D|nr:LuxR family transcriptional regulator [Raoultibacter phocaeensis]
MNEPRKTEAPLARIAALIEPRFPLRLLGFGLVYVWSTCVWELSIFSPIRASEPTGYLFDIWLLSAFLTPIACIACALAGRNRELIDRPALIIAGPLLSTIGTLCIALFPLSNETLQPILGIAAGMGTGIGPAILVVLWVGLYAKLDTDTVETVVPASFFVIIVCMLVIPYLPTAIASAVAILLPLASSALLIMSMHSVETGATGFRESAESTEEAQPYPLSSITRIFLLILAAYAISCTIPSLQQHIEPVVLPVATNIIGILFAIAVSLAIVSFSSRIDLDAYFRWMSTPLILSVVLTAFPDPIAATAASILANAMFTSLEIIMILYFIRLARKVHRPVSLFIGIGACATYSGLLIGYLLGSEWAALAADSAMSVQLFCLVLIGVFAFAMLLVPRNDPAWSGALPPSPADKSVPSNPQKSFDTICDELAVHYALSKRETDVFKLLAQGRSQPYIREALFLSKNTVSTHIRHIYRKLDIHSKEELIDMLDRG